VKDGTAAWVAIATAPDARLRGFCHFDAESRHSSVYLADNCLGQESGGADKFSWGRVSLSTQIYACQMFAQVLTILAPEQVTLDNHPRSFPVFDHAREHNCAITKECEENVHMGLFFDGDIMLDSQLCSNARCIGHLGHPLAAVLKKYIIWLKKEDALCFQDSINDGGGNQIIAGMARGFAQICYPQESQSQEGTKT